VESSGFFTSNEQNGEDRILIANGGTSSVYRVRYENKFMVLKTLKPEFIGQPAYISSLLREFEIGFQLNHPNIIQYHSCDHNPQSPTILMEYVDGETLSSAIESPGFNLDGAAIHRIIIQLIDVLEYLHSQQLYHLDVKPENLMVTRRGKNLKLIDFGHASSDAYNKKWGGTEKYMRTKDSNDIGSTEDIHALAKVIEELGFVSPQLTKLKERCIAADENNPPSYDELKALLSDPTPTKSSNIGWWITGASVILGVVLFYVFSTQQPATLSVEEDGVKVDQSLSVDAFIQDSIEIVELVSNFSIYIATDQLQGLNMNDRTLRLTQLTDSIQNEWYVLSEKWPVESVDYQKAYALFTELFTKAQSDAMEAVFE